MVLFLFTLAGYISAQSIALTDDGTITEGTENTEVITITLSGTGLTFEDPLNDAENNISVTNLPGGVTYSISRVNDTELSLTLTANREKDYDSDILNLAVSVADAEIDGYSGTALGASSGVTFTAVDDTESLNVSFDGTITEGSEGGEVITVSITGGTFADPVTEGSWNLSNLPAGVTKGTVSLTNSTTVEITLSGDRTQDYDTHITNIGLTVLEAEVDDTTGADFSFSDIATITAIDDDESLSMEDDGEILEGSEDGEIISVTLTGGTFVETLTPADWVLTNLPHGVTKGTVTRTGSTSATVALSGNRNVDYSSDIIDLTLTIASSEINDTSGGPGLTVNTGVTFTALDEPSATLTSGTPGICEGDTYNLEVTVSGGNGPWDVTYRKPDLTEEKLDNKTGTFTISVSNPGEYILTAVEDDDGVAGTVSGSLTLTVNSIPTPSITASTTTPCRGAIEVYHAKNY